MRVLVCGGRDFNDYELLNRELNEIRFKDTNREFTAIIHGAARGADTLAGEYAERHGMDVLPFPASWNKHGKAAGAIRNTQMLVEGRPDLVVAFPGGKGTSNMIKQAREAGVKVYVVN